MKEEQTPRVSGHPRRPRILVVDDNADAGETLSALLAAHDFEVVYAADGPSALDEAPLFCPDLAILDIGLPVMDGYELAARIRALPQGAPMHLIALSGYGSDTDPARAVSAGFDHHLVKPAPVADLIDAIRRLLRQA
ncbi:MAG TPA: response regulator [Noviherbaspirillum sp.]